MANDKPALPALRTYAHDLETERARHGLPPVAPTSKPTDTVAMRAPATAAIKSVTPPPPPIPAAPIRKVSVPPPEIKPVTPRTPASTPPPPPTRPPLPTTAPPFHALKATAQKQLHDASAAHAVGDSISITNDESGAVVITDTKTGGFRLGRGIIAAIREWWLMYRARARAKALPKYVVPDADHRKGVIQRATSQTGRSISDDVAPLRESIKERVVAPEPVPPVQVPPTITNVNVVPLQRPLAATPPPVEIPPVVRPAPIIAPEPVPPPAEEQPLPRAEPEPSPEEEKLTPIAVTPPAATRNNQRLRLTRPSRTLFTPTTLALGVVGIAVVLAGVLLGMKTASFFTTTPIVDPADPVTPQPTPPVAGLPNESLLLTGGDSRSVIFERITDNLVHSSNTAARTLRLERAGTSLPPHELLTTIDPTIPLDLAYGVTDLRIGRTSDGVLFVVLSVTDRLGAWGGLLQWEPTLPQALEPLFESTDNPAVSFVDRTTDTFDLRVYRDGSAEELAYGFANDTTVIITTTTAVFQEVTALVLDTD
jgi:hypothetical protein